MVVKEGETQWAPASSVDGLFLPVADNGKPRELDAPRKTSTRRPALLWAAGGCAVLLLVVLLAWSRSPNPRHFSAGIEPSANDGPSTRTVPVPPELGYKLLNDLNDIRQSAGLGFVFLDPEASQKCQEQALALVRNPHSENSIEDRPLVFYREPGQALQDALAQTSQRMSLFDRQLDSIGLGIVHTEADTWVTVLQVRRANEGQSAAVSVVVYPADRQQDVPAYFSGGPELPGPIARQVAGFPITATLPRKMTITEIRSSVTEGNIAVLYDLVKDRSFHGVGLLPKNPLKANTTYRVDLAMRIDGRPWNKTWTFTTGDDADSQGILAQKALARINDYRQAVGLRPVALDANLSRGCRNHARYLTINANHPKIKGLLAHEEQRTLPGYTAEGERAAKGVIADGQHDPLAALDAWMATFYHRIPLLDPRLTRIGFGCALGQRQTWVCVVDVASARDTGTFKIPIVYPAHNQINVPLCFSGNEVPDPIPDDKDGKAGYPVTITFPEQRLEKARASFKDESGREVPVWFSTPDKPANPRHIHHQGSTVCLIAQDPLRPHMKYSVELSGEVQGRAWNYAWSFTTGTEGITSAQAAAQVLQRINVHRTQAGLPRVTLDQASSGNCEAHARYLLQNASRISAKKFNDEDPQLPGFTPGGQTTARSAAVFFHAPEPIVQIDTMMACFQRSYLLDPALRRIGFGAGLELGRGWTCVLDFSTGREEP
jgi:uncharacterized protein YkwD